MANESTKPAAPRTTRSGIPLKDVYGPSDVRSPPAPPPGEYPFTRGIHPSMDLGKGWTMRQDAGLGTPRAAVHPRDAVAAPGGGRIPGRGGGAAAFQPVSDREPLSRRRRHARRGSGLHAVGRRRLREGLLGARDGDRPLRAAPQLLL